MERSSFSDAQKLLNELVLPFYEIERDMHVPLTRGRRLENDAEHSWSLGLVACTLAPHIAPELDIGKVAQLTHVHDLVEIQAGDTSVWDGEGRKTKEQREEQAVANIKQEFAAFAWLIDNIVEYE